MNAVYRRELRANLFSMTGTVFVVFALVLIGLYSALYTFQGSAHLEFAVVSASFMSLLAVPILTMRTFTEERQTKTDQLLFSLPITTADIVLGKFFALATIMAIPTAIFCIFPLVTASLAAAGSAVNFGLIYATILCYYLLGCAVIAICMMLSSLTESQVISAVMSLAAMLFLFFMSDFASLVPATPAIALAVVIIVCIIVAYTVYTTVKSVLVSAISGAVLIAVSVVVYVVKSSLYEGLLAKVLNIMAVFKPINTFANGVFDVTAIIYYISVICLFVFLTAQSIEKRRWN